MRIMLSFGGGVALPLSLTLTVDTDCKPDFDFVLEGGGYLLGRFCGQKIC